MLRPMERPSLRPVPSRPAGPADPADAARHVKAQLPALDAESAAALGAVALAGRSRAEAAEAAGLPADDLAEALARGRKALRRSLKPLAGSGWCERAERLISDRLDGELTSPGTERLEVHLRNCDRCVEHERRLVQATDSLVASFGRAHPVTAPGPARAAARPARLAVVEPGRPAPISVRPYGEPVTLPVTAKQRAVAATWHLLFAVAIVLAVISVALAVLGVLGGEL
jgi:Putative zinc-finger